MNNSSGDKEWSISDESFEIKSAIKKTYETLVQSEKLFPNNYSLFCTGLVYGLLHNKKHDVTPTSSFIKLFAIHDPVSNDVIDLVYRLLDDGVKNKNEIWQQMLSIADGGVLALNVIFDTNKNLRIPHLLKEAEELWSERAKSLHNIKL